MKLKVRTFQHKHIRVSLHPRPLGLSVVEVRVIGGLLGNKRYFVQIWISGDESLISKLGYQHNSVEILVYQNSVIINYTTLPVCCMMATLA